jgi:hypothetical protein
MKSLKKGDKFYSRGNQMGWELVIQEASLTIILQGMKWR